MKVLIACEYSGIVSAAFQLKGHNVTSCDLLPGDNPSIKHLQDDVFNVLKIEHFDMMIAFPPCTYLCNARLWDKSPGRVSEREKAFKFVQRLLASKVQYIAIENPKGYLNTHLRPPDQIISPHYFGSAYSKDICLWLKNLPPLIYTCISSGKKKVGNHVNSRMTQEQKSKIKSKFFPEVAAAMANQWSY